MIEIFGYRITADTIETINPKKRETKKSPSPQLPPSPSIRLSPAALVWLFTLFIPLALGQTFNLNTAANRALEQGSELSNQRAVLSKARADLNAIESDPSALTRFSR